MIDKRLKKLRENKNQSQIDVCKALNIEQSTLANYENGKRMPKVDILIKIAKYYNVTTDYLLGLQESNEISFSNPAFQTMTHREQNLIETFRQLNSDNKDIAVGEIKKLLKEQNLIELQSEKSSLKKIT